MKPGKRRGIIIHNAKPTATKNIHKVFIKEAEILQTMSIFYFDEIQKIIKNHKIKKTNINEISFKDVSELQKNNADDYVRLINNYLKLHRLDTLYKNVIEMGELMHKLKLEPGKKITEKLLKEKGVSDADAERLRELFEKHKKISNRQPKTMLTKTEKERMARDSLNAERKKNLRKNLKEEIYLLKQKLKKLIKEIGIPEKILELDIDKTKIILKKQQELKNPKISKEEFEKLEEKLIDAHVLKNLITMIERIRPKKQ